MPLGECFGRTRSDDRVDVTVKQRLLQRQAIRQGLDIETRRWRDARLFLAAGMLQTTGAPVHAAQVDTVVLAKNPAGP
ncbi:Uncharacterised protein [Mycobacteroides abscessus subsp. abscessus]|nr:Uncharacterised protein [Mycobacteroides abscessus subsp. abscessus]